MLLRLRALTGGKLKSVEAEQVEGPPRVGRCGEVDVFGFNVKVVFLVLEGDVLAYSWHYTKEKTVGHMKKIVEFHGLDGELKKSSAFERWLREWLSRVVVQGERYELPDFKYRHKRVYEKLLEVPKGETITYSELARASGVKYQEVLAALMRNPFQVLVPCHRLLTRKRTLMGFYPLGKDVKRRLLEVEGVRLKW